jgi:UDP-2,3-diacylglucosamine hydrolase
MKASSRPERILLISDLHLEESRPDLTRALLDFLDREAPATSILYILGDLFNAWIGDDDDRPLNSQIASALRSHTDAGLQLYLMHGNRDFVLGEDFAKRAGAQFVSDPCTRELAGQSCLLMHGDSLCTRDAAYQAFRAQVRDPAWQQVALAKPLQERRAIAEQMRATSKSMSSNKAEDIMDVTQEEVERQLIAHGCSTLIHGHTHRPAVHKFSIQGKALQRIVLGDWDAQGWYLEITPEAKQLQHFNINP